MTHRGKPISSTVTLRNDGSTRVLIAESWGGRNPYTNYIEVSANTDYTSENLLEIKDYSYRRLRNPYDNLANWVSRDSGFSPATHDVSIESIEQAEYILRDYVNVKLPAIIEQGKNHPAYDQMVSEMVRNNLPSGYDTDFYYHDTKMLADDPVKFIWILRDGGTHFITCKCDWNRATLSYKHSKPHYYIFEAGELNECFQKDAESFYLKSLE